jgi:hypothetical protein
LTSGIDPFVLLGVNLFGRAQRPALAGRAPRLDNRVARLSAILLVVLCILPFTAPFSAISGPGPSDLLTTVTHDPAAQSAGSGESTDAVALKRSNFLRQAKGCALAVVVTIRDPIVFVSVCLLHPVVPPAVVGRSARSPILRL